VADASSVVADQDQLERAFRRLRPEDRAIIVLRHFLDLPVPEIADAMRIPLGTAKARLHRAMDQLRASLEADARLTPGLAEDALT
jgi:RNA polymerase sigma factor (sigma-70 family)